MRTLDKDNNELHLKQQRRKPKSYRQSKSLRSHCSLIWKKHTTESPGKNCIGACETRVCQRCTSDSGLGTGAVEASLGEARNESVRNKDRVNVPERNAIRKC